MLHCQWATLGSVAITLLLLGATLHSVARDVWLCSVASCPRHSTSGRNPSASLPQELLANGGTSSDHKTRLPMNTSQGLADTPVTTNHQAGSALMTPPAQQVRERLLQAPATVSQPAWQGSQVQARRGTDSMQQLHQQLKASFKDWRRTKPLPVQGHLRATQLAPPTGV